MSEVSFVKIKDKTQDSLKQAIENSLNLIDYSFAKSIQNVIIKVNLCYYWDCTTGQTTDPKFIASLVDILRKQISNQVNITIVETDASAMKCKYAFKLLGYEKMAKEIGVNLVNLSEDKAHIVELTAGGKNFSLSIPQTLSNADLKINIPKIKYTFDPIKITCALKNIFGCIPYPRKYRFHPHLGETIVAANKAMKFDLCLIDGVIVSGNAPRYMGLVMASRDTVAIDAAAAEIAGVNPKKIKYLNLAHQEGLGNISFKNKGYPIKYFKERYPRRNLKNKVLGNALKIATKIPNLSKRLGI